MRDASKFNFKITQRKAKPFKFSISASLVLSLLIVHAKVEPTMDLLYWYLINLVVVYVFFAVFRLYFIVNCDRKNSEV